MDHFESTKRHSIYNSIPIAIIESNEKMTIQFANNYAHSLFGYNDDELVGKNVKILMTDDIAMVHDIYVERYITTSVPHVIGKKGRRINGKHKDGSILKLLLCLNESSEDGKRLFTASFENFTLIIEEKNKRIEDFYRLEKQKLQIIKNISSPANDIADFLKKIKNINLTNDLKSELDTCILLTENIKLTIGDLESKSFDKFN